MGRPPGCACQCQVETTGDCSPFSAIAAVWMAAAIPGLKPSVTDCNGCSAYHTPALLPFVGIVGGNCTWECPQTINCPGQGGTFPLWKLTLFAGAGEFTLLAGLGGSNTIAEYVFANLALFKPLAANTFTSLGNFGVGCVTFPNTLVLTPAP